MVAVDPLRGRIRGTGSQGKHMGMRIKASNNEQR